MPPKMSKAEARRLHDADADAASQAKAAKKDAKASKKAETVMDRGVKKEVKNCAHQPCGKPFTWRKKWATDWDNVLYCSDKCKKEASTLRGRSSSSSSTG